MTTRTIYVCDRCPNEFERKAEGAVFMFERDPNRIGQAGVCIDLCPSCGAAYREFMQAGREQPKSDNVAEFCKGCGFERLLCVCTDRSTAGDTCEVGNECGRTGCPECQQ